MGVLNWQKMKTHQPSDSGKYLVTICPSNGQRVQVYADLAYYRGNQGKWYSFARVNNRDLILEDITSTIVSFVDQPVEISLTILDNRL